MLIENSSSKISIFVSSVSGEMGFSHPLGKIIQLSHKPIFALLKMESGVEWYVREWIDSP